VGTESDDEQRDGLLVDTEMDAFNFPDNTTPQSATSRGFLASNDLVSFDDDPTVGGTSGLEKAAAAAAAAAAALQV
jgi:hypothetical protein